MKKLVVVILCISLLLCMCVTVYAHPGKTDDNGGHFDRSTGEYHYHHGYGAHQHTDMDGDGVPDCPYDFDDQTGSRSGSSSQTHVQSSTSVSRNPTESSTKVYVKEDPVEVMPTWVYIVFSVLAVVIFAMFIICKGKDNQISDLTMEIHRIRSDADYNRKRAAEDLNAQSAHFNEIIVNMNSELHKANMDLELLQNENAVLATNLKLAEKKKRESEIELRIIRGNVPPYISFAEDGMPVYWKYNKDKPYGDFTVYLNRKNGIYHFDYFCAPYSAEKTHLFKVLKCARPCQKCSFRNHEITEIPYWYGEDDTSLDK